MSEYKLDLDNYEAANLLWLLNVARRLHLDTGDWLGQLKHKLHSLGTLGAPNWGPEMTDEHVVGITDLRAQLADTKAECAEAYNALTEYVRLLDRACGHIEEGEATPYESVLRARKQVTTSIRALAAAARPTRWRAP